ncbi:MAG: WYL domain-containing protein [Caldilineaceae bacterium]
MLPKATRAQAEALQAMIGFYAITRPPLNLDDPKFAQLLSAIEKRRLVRLHYHAQHSNEVTRRDVEPLHLGFVDNAWILGAYCRMRQDQRNFRLDRIDALTMLRETFAPRQKDPEPRDRGDLQVVVRFDDAIVRWVREDQHFTFRTEEPHERGVHMHYHVREFQQIRRWLLGWGAQAEVISPSELRAELLQIAQKQVALLTD